MVLMQVLMLSSENLSIRSLAFVPLMYIAAIGPIFICLYILKNAGTFSLKPLKNGLEKLKRLKERFSVRRRTAKQ
mgnify:FL=1